MIGDTDIAIEVKRRSLEEINLIDPVHNCQGDEGNQQAKRSLIPKENGHIYLVNEITVSLSDLKLRILELFVQLALEGIHSVLVTQISVSEPSFDFSVDPGRIDELVEDFDGWAVGDEVVGVEVKVVMWALEDVKEEESKTWTDELSEDWFVHVCRCFIYLRFVSLASHKTSYHFLQDRIGADDDSSGNKDEDLRWLGEREFQDRFAIVEHEV